MCSVVINGFSVILILTLVRQALCYYQIHNVGTVLYCLLDKTKTGWTTDELALLQARRYAQNLVPPSDVNEQIDEEYIKNLLKYFKAIYKTVKKESPDGHVCDIMTTAISDTLGGYLKVWVLPITKFAFYSGSVSKESARIIFDFYEDIKKYLKTDGYGWHEPDMQVLKSVGINIAPAPKFTYTLNTNFPCDNLVFFEKTDTGLKIPIPTINWENNTGTMFLPLKNQSLISLNSPDSAHALFKYYDAAKRCLSYARIYDENEFNDRFQYWLFNKVLPHLNDENLYYGLDSVLCLVNKTKELSGKVTDMHDKLTETKSQHSDFISNFASKKILIVTIILFLEICWCIPAMVYMKLTKENNNKKHKNSYVDVCISYEEKPAISASTLDEDNSARPKYLNDDCGMRLCQKPRPRYMELGVKTGSLVVNEESRLKSSSSKIHAITETKSHTLKTEPYCYDCASNTSNFTTHSSLIRPRVSSTSNKLANTKTVTLFKNNQQNKKISVETQKDITVPNSSNSIKSKTKTSSHPKSLNLKETPVVFKEPARYTSIIRLKKSKKSVGDKTDSHKTDDDVVVINTKPNVCNDSKTNQAEKSLPKNKKIVLSRKGAKSNVGKRNLGIKIERHEADTANLSDVTDKSKPEITPSPTTSKKIIELFTPGTSKEIREAPLSINDDEDVVQNLKKEITNDRFLDTIKSEEDSELVTTI